MRSFRTASNQKAYLPITETEETETDSTIPRESALVYKDRSCESRQRSFIQSPWTFHLIAFLIYSAIFWTWSRVHPHKSCIEKLSLYSPALEATSDDYKLVRWNLSSAYPSIWAGPPTESVDAAWKKYTSIGALILSQEDLIKINGSRYSSKVPKEVGDGYIAHVEWYHQLHCVYMLWQQTYPEFYTEEATMKEEENELWHEHLDHCAETLRSSIMCHADANIVPSNWVKGRHWPHPNYNLDHKCRDFDAAYQWAVDHQANPPPGFELFGRPEEGGYSEFSDLPFDPFDAGTVVPLKEKGQ